MSDSWSSRKQNLVPLSIVEVECVAAGSCCSQLLWIKHQLEDGEHKLKRILMLCDNTSAINLTKIPIQHSRTKYIKIPEVSSPFGKAVEVLDTLNSLNTRSRSSPGRLGGGQKVSILAFEVANTIAKGAILMQSLSEKNLHFLKKEVLHSDGIQRLVSTDIYELLNIVAADKREEFVVIFKEVVRFGDLCKDPQWHNLCRCFNRFDWNATSWDSATLMPLKKEAETIMQHLVNLAQYTYELYHELQALDRTVQNYNWKLQEEATLSTAERGKNLMLLRHELHELKNQRKLVKSLKKKSLWSSNLEEVSISTTASQTTLKDWVLWALLFIMPMSLV